MTREIFGDELADKLAPGLVSPVVAWLAHEDCPVSGHTYSVGGGRVARVFVGEGPGYLQAPTRRSPSKTCATTSTRSRRTDDFTLLQERDRRAARRSPSCSAESPTNGGSHDHHDRPHDRRRDRRGHAWLEENWDPDLTVEEWWDRLGRSGWAVPTWPVEWYGKGLSRAEGVRVQQAIAAFGALGAPGGLGTLLAGPTITVHGTDEQKERYLLDIVTGRKAWCQLFSEPGAGLRPRRAQHARRARRRRVGRQRAEGVDLGRALVRPRHAARPHRSRRAEAPGHHLLRASTCTSPASRSAR